MAWGDKMRCVQFMQMMEHLRWETYIYTNDTKTKNVPSKLSLPGSALHSLTEYTLQNNSDPHLLRMWRNSESCIVLIPWWTLVFFPILPGQWALVSNLIELCCLWPRVRANICISCWPLWSICIDNPLSHSVSSFVDCFFFQYRQEGKLEHKSLC